MKKIKISNKKKFIVRIVEILIIIVTIILTILAFDYAREVRGYDAVGGEFLIPILGLLIILLIEDAYEESERNKKKSKYPKHGKNKKKGA